MIGRMKWIGLVLALGGCDAVFGLDMPKLHDATRSVDSNCTNIGHYGEGGGGWFLTCVPDGADDVVLGFQTVDTSNDSRCGNDPVHCTIMARMLTISQDVHVVGKRSLVLVATGSITIDALLDASASRDGSGQLPGPGAGAGASPACMDIPDGASSTTGGGAGGAGASWQTRGGEGGAGDAGLKTPSMPPALHPVTLLAGCRGGGGGKALDLQASGGGFGGGAVYLAAPVITFGPEAAIDARGNGGEGGDGMIMGAGGGGGGTGGLIVFDTRSFEFPIDSAILNANGGGGGGGGGGSVGGLGFQSATPSSGGSGGAGGPMGGVGGVGASGNGDGQPGSNGNPNGGGGGGGGAEGFILLFSAGATHSTDRTRVSPDLTIL